MSKVATMFPIADVTTAEMAFGGDTDKLMPAMKDIPKQFRSHNGTKWNRLASDWFFSGVENLSLQPRDGVDTQKALRHIRAILISFAPKHEHKEAGIAYLLDQWFSDGTWDRAK